MVQIYNLREKEVNQIVQQLFFEKEKMKLFITRKANNAFEEAMLRGYDEGKEIGIKIGLEIGIAIGRKTGEKLEDLRKTIEIIVGLLKNVLALNDTDIATICKTDVEFLAKVRLTLQTDKKEDIKKFVREIFQIVPYIKEKDYLKIEEFAVNLWREFKGM